MSLVPSPPPPRPTRGWFRHPLNWGLLATMVGVAMLVSAMVVHREALGHWLWILIPAVVATASGTWILWIFPHVKDEQAAEVKRMLADRLQNLENDQRRLESDQRNWESEVEKQVRELQDREQDLADRLVTFHEWMEFPQPVRLQTRASEPIGFDGGDEQPLVGELVERDRRMLELLRTESQRLFEAIRANRYVVDGKFQPLLLRDEAWQLAERVAKIYRPDSDQPLLETSPELIFRAISRVSLQFLVTLDVLPIDVKKLTLTELYQYVRQAVRAYDVYKSVEPYWGYVSSAFYLSRFAMGANPVSLGTWWFVSTVGKKGAERLTQHLVNRQAIAWMNNLIRVVGFEVAALYGGDFRHRDANWIYATELVELIHAFPLSRKSLHGALRELGALQLRSEYDRVFLYRCVAAHASADPQRYRAAEHLSMEERRAVATRLEMALATFVASRSAAEVKAWQTAVEERLQIKMASTLADPRPEIEQRCDGIRSLASFLVAIKEFELDQINSVLRGTKLAAGLSAEQLESLFADLRDACPQFFEHTELDPGGSLVDDYLQDLSTLATKWPPRAPLIDEILEDTATYLRRDAKEMRRRFETQLQEACAQRWQAGARPRKLPTNVARVLMDLLNPNESLQFVYDDASVVFGESRASLGSVAIFGTATRLAAVAYGDSPRLLWIADASARADRTDAMFFHDCQIRGGHWQIEHAERATIRIPGAKLSSFDAFFGPLKERLEQLRV